MRSMNLQVEQLDHVALHVANLERSVRFFREILGLPLMPRPAFSFPGAWFGLGNFQQLHLITAHPEEMESSSEGIHFALRIEDVDRAMEHLKEVGARFRGPKLRPDGLRQIFLADPDGHTIELLGI